MGASVIHDAHLPRAVPKGDQFFAQQHQADRRAAGLEFQRHGCWNPVLPHQFAHGGSGTYTTKQIAVFF